MKNVLMIALLFGLFSCGDDSDPNEDVNNMLSGDWFAESLTVDGVETVGVDFNEVAIRFNPRTDTEGDLTIVYDISEALGGGHTIEYKVKMEASSE